MIITVFDHLYTFDTKAKTLEKKDSSDWIKKFKKNARKYKVDLSDRDEKGIKIAPPAAPAKGKGKGKR